MREVQLLLVAALMVVLLRVGMYNLPGPADENTLPHVGLDSRAAAKLPHAGHRASLPRAKPAAQEPDGEDEGDGDADEAEEAEEESEEEVAEPKVPSGSSSVGRTRSVSLPPPPLLPPPPPPPPPPPRPPPPAPPLLERRPWAGERGGAQGGGVQEPPPGDPSLGPPKPKRHRRRHGPGGLGGEEGSGATGAVAGAVAGAQAQAAGSPVPLRSGGPEGRMHAGGAGGGGGGGGGAGGGELRGSGGGGGRGGAGGKPRTGDRASPGAKAWRKSLDLAGKLQADHFTLAGAGGGGGDFPLAKEDVDIEQSMAAYKQAANNHTTHLALEKELIARLPSRDYAADGSTRHRSCALVGNSGTLLGGKQGRAIDGHDAVMRVNYAPIHGWEADVGRKTTYDFSNRENARRILQGRKFAWRSPESTLLFFETQSPVNRRSLFVPLLKKYPSARVHFMHPAFVLRALALWNELKGELEETKHTKYHDKPMSGWTAVMFMTQVCESLTLYGFEAYKSKARAKAPYHYFDGVQGVTSVHSFDLAMEVFKMVGEVYPLTLASPAR